MAVGTVHGLENKCDRNTSTYTRYAKGKKHDSHCQPFIEPIHKMWSEINYLANICNLTNLAFNVMNEPWDQLKFLLTLGAFEVVLVMNRRVKMRDQRSDRTKWLVADVTDVEWRSVRWKQWVGWGWEVSRSNGGFVFHSVLNDDRRSDFERLDCCRNLMTGDITASTRFDMLNERGWQIKCFLVMRWELAIEIGWGTLLVVWFRY